MQAATKATLLNLVEQHVTSLVRECAVINRHSKRSGYVSAAAADGNIDVDLQNVDDDDDDVNNKKRQRRSAKRLLIHHDDVNLALSWRGSEKLYVSGVPLLQPRRVAAPDGGGDAAAAGGGSSSVAATTVTDDDEVDGNKRKRKRNKSTTTTATSSSTSSPLGHLLRTTTTATDSTTIPALISSSTVPRIDLNAYLQSELMVRPPSELGMTLHWLAVEGMMPMIPANEIWNQQQQQRVSGAGTGAPDIIPALLLDDDNGDDDAADIGDDDDDTNSPSAIRIRELQHRLLSEELQLYYSHITTTLSNPHLSSDSIETLTVLSSLRNEGGHIQELIPFLCRFVVSGLVTRRNLRNTELCMKLVRMVDAMLDNCALHLDLHLHQLFIPLGTCVVAKNLSGGTGSSSSSSSSSLEDHWALREEAAKCLVKTCNIYGDQYTTMRPRLIKLLTQQALRLDRPYATQYGGIVGISLFGPRAIDAFILPLAREYWECWVEELRMLRTTIAADNGHDGDTTPEGSQQRNEKGKKRRRDVEGREYELHMCQRALLSAMQIFMQNVTHAEKAKRVDIRAFMDVFGERLIPMQPDLTDYMAAVV